MQDRSNTIFGWVLGSGIVALGMASFFNHVFEANHPERPEKMGYAIEGVVSSEGGAAEAPIETLLASSDVTKGEAVFKKCASCHTINAGGANGIGPNLHGVVGKGIAKSGFAFSDPLKSKGGDWNWQNLSDWLKNPREFAPGTKMSFAGLSSGEDRANVIAYMNAQGSNLPLPKAAEAAPNAAQPKEGQVGVGLGAPAAGGGAAPAAAGATASAAPAAGATGEAKPASAAATPGGSNDNPGGN